jgi:hypothetical protein
MAESERYLPSLLTTLEASGYVTAVTDGRHFNDSPDRGHLR